MTCMAAVMVWLVSIMEVESEDMRRLDRAEKADDGGSTGTHINV